MSSTVRDKLNSTIVTRKKSRRQTSIIPKGPAEGEADDCKRFPYLLQKYSEERLYYSLPHIYTYFTRDDGVQIQLDHPLFPLITTPNVTKVSIYAYSNHEMKLITLLCKSTDVIDTRLFFALNQTFAHFPTLSSLKLDYCNLTADHIMILQENLKLNKAIVELSLMGNPIKEQNFHSLIRCGLKVLVLKLCDINERGLRNLAKEFLNRPLNAATLIHLDLSSNMVFDEGCKHIANILKCDRTLQSLNLTDCKIRDKGFKSLIACFSKVTLGDTEIAFRRKIRLSYFKYLHKANVPSDGNVLLNAGRGRVNSGLTPAEDFSTIEEIMKKHPFICESFPEDGLIFCRGNYTLGSLNLAYNHLTKSSLDLLLKTLMEQSTAFGPDKGLQRIELEGNSQNNRECDDVKSTILELLENKRMHGEHRASKTSVKRLSGKKRRSSASGSAISSLNGREKTNATAM